jgi:hypothetical protein
MIVNSASLCRFQKLLVCACALAIMLGCGGGGSATGGGTTSDPTTSADPFTIFVGSSPSGSTQSVSANTTPRLFVKLSTTTGSSNVVVQVSGCSTATRCESPRDDYDAISLQSTAPITLTAVQGDARLSIGSAVAGQKVYLSVELRGQVLKTTLLTVN